MSNSRTPPQFSPPDSEGFQTVEMKIAGPHPAMRLSVHFPRMIEGITETLKRHHSEKELEVLRTTADMLTGCENGAQEYDPELASQRILEAVPNFISISLNSNFCAIVEVAIATAIEMCVKHGIAGLAESQHVPLYGKDDVDALMSTLKKTASLCLMIQNGRPPSVSQHIEQTRIALDSLDLKLKLRAQGKTPTQEQVAEEMGIKDERTVREWLHRNTEKDWAEWLTICGWHPGKN